MRVPGRIVDVSHFQNLKFLYAFRGRQKHRVSLKVLEKNSGDRRDPGNISYRGVGLVDPDNTNLGFIALLIGINDGGSEEDLIRRRSFINVDDFARLDSLIQEADAAVDFTKTLFTLLVVGVFTAVAVRSRPSDDIHDIRTLD